MVSQSQLAHLSPVDQGLFQSFGFGEEILPPFRCVHHAFASQALSSPDAIAVEHLDSSITYAELDRQSFLIASLLRQRGICPGTRVCLVMQRSISFVIAILAVLRAGGQYIPLDGAIVTQATLNFILQDACPTIVISLEEFSSRISGRPVLVLEEALDAVSDPEFVPTPFDDLATLDSGCYVIYTSGTTGKPKGVDVLHRNVTNLICLKPGNLGMSPGIRVAQLLNIAFDMAAWEMLGSLCNGCTLCIRGRTSKEWCALMKTVDIVIATPSILSPHDPDDYSNIKVVALAGEPCPQALADRWSTYATLYNSCGPTEITIVNTVQKHRIGNVINIGRPTPNNNVYVLDEAMKPVPIGSVGIMWAGGEGITQGYLNLPDKTSEKYRNDPFSQSRGMMFNTGDLGRWRSDGNLEHFGRIDDQVKIKGFRVELDGVVSALEACKGVEKAAALLVDSELWGFLTPENVNPAEARNVAQKIQPYYAVPTKFMTLSAFPLTSNGKTDKRALRAMAATVHLPNHTKQKSSTAAITPIVISDFSRTQSNGLANILLSEPSTWPASPPPVYQKEAHASETALAQNMMEAISSNTKADEVEKGSYLGWEGYEDEDLPNKLQGHILRNIRHQIFTLYRRLFGVVFVANAAILVATYIGKAHDAQTLGLIVVANIFCAVLMRQDYVINAFFSIFCSVPTSWPLRIRRVAARVYHIGGLHSGCAISGIVWMIAFTVQVTLELSNGGKSSSLTVVLTYIVLSLLLGIATFAYPRFRLIFHDQFEMVHRFCGWTAVLLVWFLVISLVNDYRTIGQSLGKALTQASSFWLLVVLTCSIILPWVRLRKQAVRSEVLSNHAVRLYFDYVTPVPGSFVRVSDRPLMEWHGFATIPEAGKKGFSLVVSRAGDWTSKQIVNPPTHLWVRGIPTCGVLRIVPLFRRLVFVATGSGIGPCAPCILEQRVPISLLWTSPNVRETFGDNLVDSICKACPNTVIYDTRIHGKPDMVKLTYKLVREFEAEAVCVISNQKLTRKIVFGMVSRGIPAFGAIWDS